VPVATSEFDAYVRMRDAQRAEEDWSKEQHIKTASVLIFTGSAVCMLSVVLVILLNIGFGLFSSKLASCTCAIAIIEMIMASLGLGSGYYLKDDVRRSSSLAIVVGVTLTVFSLFALGGILGVFGGAIILAGGLMAATD